MSDEAERDWAVCHTIARWETLKLKVRAATAEDAREKAREIVEQAPTAEYEPGDLCSDVDDEFDVREARPDDEGSFYEPESY